MVQYPSCVILDLTWASAGSVLPSAMRPAGSPRRCAPCGGLLARPTWQRSAASVTPKLSRPLSSDSRNMDGSLGPQAQRTLAFTQALQSLGLPIVFYDERLSSVAAEEYVTATRGRRPRPDERLDHVAAAIILQDYLDSSQ